MPKTRELTELERHKIVLLKSQGFTYSEIARQTKCSRSTARLTINRYNETRSLKNRPKNGRKKITTDREDRSLERNCLKNRRNTSSVLAAELQNQTGKTISARTVRKRLQDLGLNGRKARKKPWLSERNKKARFEWAKNYESWTYENWKNILWSDETNIEIFGTAGSSYVRRRVGEEYLADCLIPTVKFGGGSIMLWGCMASSGVGKCFVCEGKMNSVTYTSMLSSILSPSMDQVFQNQSRESIIFQQDNAPCHTARASQRWFTDNQIEVLPWPAQSPDINPIEHLWTYLKKKVRNRNPRSKEDLKRCALEEWGNIPKSFCARLINSMPARVKATIKAKGGATKY